MQLTRRSAFPALAACALIPMWAAAQSPGNITFIVPYPPGSAPDLLARVVSAKAQSRLGQSVIVENRPGANAIVGSQFVSQARPDGLTYLLVDRMTLVANPLLYPSLPYDPKALTAITDVGRTNLLLTTRSDAPYGNWKEFITYAQANPGKISIGTGGQGSVHHISLELLSAATGSKFTHVPYKGITPAVQDMLSSQISGVISGVEVIRPHMAGGKLRVLGIGAQERSPLLPEVPTLKELGFANPILLPTTFTLFAPPRTPEPATARLADAVRAVLAEPDTAARLADTGITPAPSRPEDILQALEAQRPQMSRIFQEAHIRLE